MFDVGGQRDERRKWIQCFNGEPITGTNSKNQRKCVVVYACCCLRLLVACVLRRDSHHLRGGQQQLQHGDQRGQLHQSAARVSGPLQIHLDQQVPTRTSALIGGSERCSLIGCLYASRFLKTISVILFLNKQDVLADKILAGKSKLEDYFPEYSNYQVPAEGRKTHPIKNNQKTHVCVCVCPFSCSRC